MLVAASIFLVLSIFSTIPAGAAALQSLTVKLRPQASIKGVALILADIADLSGEEESKLEQLARTPLGSVSGVRILSRAEVASLIRNERENLQDVILTGADFTRVSQTTRAPQAAEISAIVKSYLASVTSWQEEEIEIHDIENLKTIAIPEDGIALRVASRGVPASFENLLLSIEAVREGKVLKAFWIKADVRVRARVVQVVKPVGFRGVIQAGDLQEAVCEIANPRADYFRASAEAVGLVAKRALGIGELLSRNCVDEASLVRSGETVRLLVQSGGVRMSLLVRALQSGKLGDPIKVRNTDSDRVITAIVTGRGEVRVTN